MRVIGATTAQIEHAIPENVRLEGLRKNGRGVNFTLRPLDSRDRYGKRSATGRRIHAVCYHGHYDFMAALFAQAPDARLTSAMADYRGVGDFNANAEYVGYRNIGSTYQPFGFEDACECANA